MALAHEQQPHVILMDIRLPDMHGTDATRLLKDNPRTAQIPIVALTSMTADPIWFREAGFDGYLDKPINVVEFADEVRRYLQ